MAAPLTPMQVKELAESTWLLAREYAEEHGTRIERKARTGYIVTVSGGVSRLIKQAAKELEMSGYAKQKYEREKVREYLKNGHNVVNLGHASGGPHVYRLFVAESWKNGVVVEHQVRRREYKVKETGQAPGGESGPVETKNLWSEFESTPLSIKQAQLVKFLYERGGKYTDPEGFTMTSLKPGFNAHTSSSLEERGIITIDKKNDRRFRSLQLTQKGWWTAERLSFCQTAEVAVARFLHDVGSFEGSSPKYTTTELAERVHKQMPAVGAAIRTLDEQLLVDATKTTKSASAPYSRVEWTGGDELPGVHILPEPKAKAEPAEQAVTEAVKERYSQEKMAKTIEQLAEEQGVAPVTDPSALAAPEGTFTEEDIDRFIEALERLRGPDKEQFQAALNALRAIHATCKKVETGDLSALKAIVNIEDIARHWR